MLPAIHYWQERRADEWAAEVVGDRLTVAAALISTAAAASLSDRRLVPFPATSFAFCTAPISSRVRRLVEIERAPSWFRLERISGRILRLAMATFIFVAALAVHRAESEGLSGVLCITDCGVSLRVERVTNAMAMACPKSPAPL